MIISSLSCLTWIQMFLWLDSKIMIYILQVLWEFPLILKHTILICLFLYPRTKILRFSRYFTTKKKTKIIFFYFFRIPVKSKTFPSAIFCSFWGQIIIGFQLLAWQTSRLLFKRDPYRDFILKLSHPGNLCLFFYSLKSELIFEKTEFPLKGLHLLRWLSWSHWRLHFFLLRFHPCSG